MSVFSSSYDLKLVKREISGHVSQRLFLFFKKKFLFVALLLCSNIMLNNSISLNINSKLPFTFTNALLYTYFSSTSLVEQHIMLGSVFIVCFFSYTNTLCCTFHPFNISVHTSLFFQVFGFFFVYISIGFVYRVSFCLH